MSNFTQSPKDFSNDPQVQGLVEAILVSLHEGYKSDLEPFEAYAQKLRSHMHHDLPSFQNRILSGYAVLLNELEKN